MAKKVRRRPEDEEAPFEFPTFDEAAYLTKEFELAGGLAVASLFAVLLGAMSWAAHAAGLPWYVPFLLAILFIAASPTLLGRLRPKASLFTKGDWAGLIALEFFGWLALWFVLVNVT